MKNNNLRTSLFSLVISLSIVCYAFLHTIEIPNTNIDPSLEVDQVEIENIANQETVMPDVKIVKTAFEFFKKMVPVSH